MLKGVNEGDGLFKEQGAGDQGMMFGYACDETEELMPLPINLAHKLTAQLAEVRKSGLIDFIGPDGKSQVSIVYDNGIPMYAKNIVISTQHKEDVSHEVIKKEITEKVILPICGDYVTEETEILVNLQESLLLEVQLRCRSNW